VKVGNYHFSSEPKINILLFSNP